MARTTCPLLPDDRLLRRTRARRPGDTFLQARRNRDRFDGGSLFRSWLNRIATNVCFDMVRRSSRRLTKMQSFADVPWLQPYPDRLLTSWR